MHPDRTLKRKESRSLKYNSYNYPGVTNNVLVQPETYSVLGKHPNIVGVKM